MKLIQALEKVVQTAPEGLDKPKLAQAVKKFQNELIGVNTLIVRENNKIKNAAGETKSFEVMAAGLAKTIKQRVDLAFDFTDDVLLQPEEEQVAYFNKHVQDVARGLTQQVGNIDKLTNMGYEFPFKQPAQLFEVMSQWANHGRRLKLDADENDVLNEVTDFRVTVDEINDWAKKIG